MSEPLCHVVGGDVAATGSISGSPFLHCCTEAQLGFVVARHFPGRTGLWIVRFEPADIRGRIEWAHSEPGQPAFPHLYGAIDLSKASIDPY